MFLFLSNIHLSLVKRFISVSRRSKMPLKFAANLSMLFKEIPDLAERYSAAKRAGFQAVEVSFPYDSPVEKLVEVKEREGLEQVLINSFPGDMKAGDLGLAAVPGREKEFQDSLELSIKYCTLLHCKRMHVMAGVTPDCTEDDRPAVHRKMEETFISNLKYAADRLSQEGILTLIEPINTVVSKPGYFLSRQDQGVDIIKKVGHPNLKLQMDLFHVQMMQGNITNTIKEFLPYIGHVQIAQAPHRNEPSAEGEVNYDFIFAFLESLGYDGWIGAEYNAADGKTQNSLQWLQKYR
ncbi:putative hydroxypyruvate isomerase [Acanthaster planci]|uniref:Putative hydroxypyruvate isomerase n=1 Tax=Acanthaster planci TaxID=133434 RepID=A0A8B7ZYF4_ACAPL|nr:putative hydroxypyruvate isomerase [Acanthaster planci]